MLQLWVADEFRANGLVVFVRAVCFSIGPWKALADSGIIGLAMNCAHVIAQKDATFGSSPSAPFSPTRTIEHGGAVHFLYLDCFMVT